MATEVSTPPTAAAPPTTAAAAPPLFEYFCSVPHPAASKSCPPLVVLPAPHQVNTGQPHPKVLNQLSAFCFPEYDEALLQPAGRQAVAAGQTTALFQHMVVNRYDQYAMQPKSFSSFTFTLQLQDGRRWYGHVRRSLPLHPKAAMRYDVGRRGERALVLLTQSAGAGQLYQAMLKSIDALTSLHKALRPDLQRSFGNNDSAEQAFLHCLYHEQQRMAAHYQQRPMEERGKPLIANLTGLELQQSTIFAHQDVHRFLIPTSLLVQQGPSDTTTPHTTADSTSSVLPLLRCIGVAHALRILSALLSERRIILTSSSPTRLSTCSHAALAMLRCGLLQWQHLYIPVLPPHLWQYLAAPYPYLIGILTSAAARKLDHTDGLGEVLLVNLDTNAMETRNIPQQVVAQRLPDLFSSADPNYYNESTAGAGTGGMSPLKRDRDVPPSASEFLAQDLLEILKTDKKALIGEGSTLTNVGETAGKAAKAIKSGFSKLKKRIKGTSSSSSNDVEEATSTEQDDTAATRTDDGTGGVGGETSSVADDYIFTEGCHNEVGEQEVRLAFTVFFLAMIGNMRWYLTVPAQGQLPQLDHNRFLDAKRKAGDGQGSAIWPLLQNFCQTQMFQEFAKARVEEIRLRLVVSTPDAPLFSQCAQYHRQHSIDFTIPSVRRVARQVAQANPGRLTGLLQTNARRMAMSLTSNKAFEGDSGRAIAQLVEQCRESSSVLFDVMSVIWLRLRDSKGMQWKHGYLAMQILKNLLYHGPLAAVAEATDGLDKIRALKYYEHMRGGVAQDMRSSASVLFNMLVDRSKLWAIRRLCAKKRRDLTIPPSKKPKLEKMVKVKPTDAIEQIHGAFHPMARATIVQIPPQSVPAALVSGQAQQAQPQQPPVPIQTSSNDDLFGFGAGAADPSTPSPASVNSDLMGLFNTMDVGGTTATNSTATQPTEPRRMTSTGDSSSASSQSANPALVATTAGGPPPPQPPQPTPPATAAPPASQPQAYYGAPAAAAAVPPTGAPPPPHYPAATTTTTPTGPSSTPGYGSFPGPMARPPPPGQQPVPPTAAAPAQAYQPQPPAFARQATPPTQYQPQPHQPAAPPAAQGYPGQPPAPQQSYQPAPQPQPQAGYAAPPGYANTGYYPQQPPPAQQPQQHQQQAYGGGANPFAAGPPTAPTSQQQQQQPPRTNNQFDPFAGSR